MRWARAKYCSMRSPTRARRSSSRRSGVCAATPSDSHAKAAPIARYGAAASEAHAWRRLERGLRLDVSLVRIGRGVGDSGFDERIVPLATLAARPTVLRREQGSDPWIGPLGQTPWAHAREAELERDAEFCAAPDHVGFASAGVRGVDFQRVPESNRQRPGHRQAEVRRGVGKWIVRERSENEAIEVRRRAVDRRLGE